MYCGCNFIKKKKPLRRGFSKFSGEKPKTSNQLQHRALRNRRAQRGDNVPNSYQAADAMLLRLRLLLGRLTLSTRRCASCWIKSVALRLQFQ